MIDVSQRLKSDDVLERIAWLFVTRGVPKHIRGDNGPEFTANVVRHWLDGVGVKTLFIEPGSPWENSYVESFNGKLRDELLNGEIFYTVKEAKVLIESWRNHYNTIRPHSSLGYRPPAPEGVLTNRLAAGCATLRPPLVSTETSVYLRNWYRCRGKAIRYSRYHALVSAACVMRIELPTELGLVSRFVATRQLRLTRPSAGKDYCSCSILAHVGVRTVRAVEHLPRDYIWYYHAAYESLP